MWTAGQRSTALRDAAVRCDDCQPRPQSWPGCVGSRRGNWIKPLPCMRPAQVGPSARSGHRKLRLSEGRSHRELVLSSARLC
eukprot:scaffold712_cov404-Prasinococcus_capsulatus_cf.AAC.12